MYLLKFVVICFFSLTILPNAIAKEVNYTKVAVVVYGQNQLAERYSRSAFTRLENILLDNGVEVLDQQQAKELKNIWKQLEDPGFFVTAETFVENTEKYSLDGIVRIYLTAESYQSWEDSYSATAIADIRFIDSNAHVNAFATVPMGVPGKPPSDGLTQSAAVVNAVQRAIDEGASKIGLEVIDYAKPRTLSFTLNEINKPEQELKSKRIKTSAVTFDRYIATSKHKTVREEFTCHATDPSEVLGVAGGYVKTTGMGQRTYASRLHVVDLTDKKEILVFDTSLNDRKHHWEKGVRKLQDCMFLSNWRFLVGLTGNHISLWDTERGLKMSEIHLKRGIKRGGALDYVSDGVNDYIVVLKKEKPVKYFSILRKSSSN